MKKATLQVAGTAVLGVAMAAAAAAPAMADDALGAVGAVTNSPLANGANPLNGVGNLTSTVQGVLQGVQPTAQQAMAGPVQRDAAGPAALPGGDVLSGLPGGQQVTGALGGGLGQAQSGLGGLPVHTPLG
ncbi:hypothetical protein [Streptacidiphilus monticola]|jgi:hypothetical protein|uniref:ATP-binding protein n=1 Tax=Streptacidiphilus monticola TaxID=2161674 RepID=A0ABW1G3Y2_9ACTN